MSASLPAFMLAASTPPWMGLSPNVDPSATPRPPASVARSDPARHTGPPRTLRTWMGHPSRMTRPVHLRPAPVSLVLLRGGAESRPVRKDRSMTSEPPASPRGHAAPRRAADDRPGALHDDHDSASSRIGDVRRRRRTSGAGPVEPRMMSRVSSRRCSAVGDIPPLDDGQQELDGLLALAADRLVDRRERWVHVRCEVDVVEPDDAHVVRDAQAEVAQGAHRADRHRVAHRQDRGRTKAVLPRALEAPRRRRRWSRGRRRRFVADRDADSRECLAIAAQAAAGHAVAIEVADGAGRLDADDEDVAMAEAERCSAAARAPSTSSTSIERGSGSAVRNRRGRSAGRRAGCVRPPDGDG